MSSTWSRVIPAQIVPNPAVCMLPGLVHPFTSTEVKRATASLVFFFFASGSRPCCKPIHFLPDRIPAQKLTTFGGSLWHNSDQVTTVLSQRSRLSPPPKQFDPRIQLSRRVQSADGPRRHATRDRHVVPLVRGLHHFGDRRWRPALPARIAGTSAAHCKADLTDRETIAALDERARKEKETSDPTPPRLPPRRIRASSAVPRRGRASRPTALSHIGASCSPIPLQPATAWGSVPPLTCGNGEVADIGRMCRPSRRWRRPESCRPQASRGAQR